jgi:hypothetical protein
MSNSPLSDLSALKLEDPLNRVLIKPQQVGHRPVAERRLFVDQGLNRLHKSRVHFGHRPAWLVVDAATGDAKPATEFGQWNLKTILFQSLPDPFDHASSLRSKDCNFFRHATPAGPPLRLTGDPSAAAHIAHGCL